MKKLILNKVGSNNKSFTWSKNLNSLKRLYGLKKYTFGLLKFKHGMNVNCVIKGLPLKTFNALEEEISNNLWGKELKRINKKRLQFLKSTKSYRSVRLIYGLPCRGQRTRTNAKTVKRFKFRKQSFALFK